MNRCSESPPPRPGDDRKDRILSALGCLLYLVAIGVLVAVTLVHWDEIFR